MSVYPKSEEKDDRAWKRMKIPMCIRLFSYTLTHPKCHCYFGERSPIKNRLFLFTVMILLAPDHMIIDHADCLKIGIDDRCADKGKAAFF